MTILTAALTSAGYTEQDNGTWTRSTADWSAVVDPAGRVITVTHANRGNGHQSTSHSFDPDRPELPGHLATPIQADGTSVEGTANV